MALCPACRLTIHDEALRCPHCHTDIISQAQVEDDVRRYRDWRITVDGRFGLFWSVVVVALSAYFGFMVVFYGVDLKKASDLLEEAEEDLAELRTKLALYQGTEKRLAELEEKFAAKLEKNVAVYGELVQYNSLPDLRELAESNQARIELLEDKSASLPDSAPFLGAETREAIAAALRVGQYTSKTEPPQGSEATERSWKRIRLTVSVDPESPVVRDSNGDTLDVMSRIEKVVYHFDPRWWANPSREVFTRSTEFAYTIEVYGVSKLEVEVFVRGLTSSLKMPVTMNLFSEESFKSFKDAA